MAVASYLERYYYYNDHNYVYDCKLFLLLIITGDVDKDDIILPLAFSKCC